MVVYLPLVITLLTVIAGLITWGLNEKSKRKLESYRKKEERYVELIKCMKGFYVNSTEPKLKENFLEQVNFCWMYCPDDVVEKLYNFLEIIKTSNSTSEQKEMALGKVMVGIRKDLLKDTKIDTNLRPQVFKIYSSN